MDPLETERRRKTLATERERQLKTAPANQTTGLTSGVGCAANWAPEVEFSPFRALSCRQMTVRMLSVCLKEGVRLFGGPLNRGFTVLNVLETENVLIKAL